MNEQKLFINNFSILMIDPPWPKKKGGLRKARPKQGRNMDYKTMGVDDVFELLDRKIFPATDSSHVVFIWTVEQFLGECEEQMVKRGYKRHCRLIWDKTNGVAPAFTIRFSHEYLIWYYKDKLIPVAKEFRGKFTTVFRERARQHSRKPDIAYNIIDALYPNLLKLDVFSREKHDGWEQFGDQINYFSNSRDLF